MGLFSKNDYIGLGSNYEVAADESYTYPTGSGRILAEAAQNDLNMFSALIARDFEEAAYIQEGYGGFSVEVITEGVTGIFSKIKELFLKLLAKIKGLFKSFMAKFDAVVIKDNKKYFDKYKSVVNSGNVKWDGFKCKYQKPKTDIGNFVIKENDAVDVYNNTTFSEDSTDKIEYSEKLYEKVFEDDAAHIAFVNALTGLKITELADFEKEFHESLFEDEDELDDTSAATAKSSIESIMIAGDNYGKTVTKNLDNFDKAIKKLVRITEDQAKAIEKVYPTGKEYEFEKSDNASNYKITTKVGTRTDSDFDLSDSTNDVKNVKFAKYDNKSGKRTINKEKTSAGVGETLKVANAYHKLAEVFQVSATKVHTAYLNELKFVTKQARTVYAAMVAHASRYKNKVVADNSSALLYVAQEAAGYEFDSDFELA
jgi:hypothetical protein